jgi:hypothetical protein
MFKNKLKIVRLKKIKKRYKSFLLTFDKEFNFLNQENSVRKSASDAQYRLH